MTLTKKHVEATGSSIELDFVDKGGADHLVRVSGRRIATHLRLIQEPPGSICSITRPTRLVRRSGSEHINEYLLDGGGSDDC